MNKEKKFVPISSGTVKREEKPYAVYGPSTFPLLIYPDELSGLSLVERASRYSYGTSERETKTIEVVGTLDIAKLLEGIINVLSRGLRRIYGYTMEPLYIKVERTIRPRPIGIEPPPRKKHVEFKPSNYAAFLHVIVDNSGSMGEEIRKESEKVARLINAYNKLYFETFGEKYVFKSLKLEKSKKSLSSYIGSIEVNGKPIRCGEIYSNTPAKLYTFSGKSYEALSRGSVEADGVIYDISTLIKEAPLAGTVPIGTFFLFLKNHLLASKANNLSVGIRQVREDAVRLRVHKRGITNVVVIISDFIFEHSLYADLLRPLIASGYIQRLILASNNSSELNAFYEKLTESDSLVASRVSKISSQDIAEIYEKASIPRVREYRDTTRVSKEAARIYEEAMEYLKELSLKRNFA